MSLAVDRRRQWHPAARRLLPFSNGMIGLRTALAWVSTRDGAFTNRVRAAEGVNIKERYRSIRHPKGHTWEEYLRDEEHSWSLIKIKVASAELDIFGIPSIREEQEEVIATDGALHASDDLNGDPDDFEELVIEAVNTRLKLPCIEALSLSLKGTMSSVVLVPTFGSRGRGRSWDESEMSELAVIGAFPPNEEANPLLNLFGEAESGKRQAAKAYFALWGANIPPIHMRKEQVDAVVAKAKELTKKPNKQWVLSAKTVERALLKIRQYLDRR